MLPGIVDRDVYFHTDFSFDASFCKRAGIVM